MSMNNECNTSYIIIWIGFNTTYSYYWTLRFFMKRE
jgi:hypothetical protein